MAKSKAKGRAQSGGTKKAVAVILALLFLAAGAFCGAGIGLRDKSSGKWYSTSTWYHNWGKSEKPGETGTPASGAVISEDESNGIMLLSEQIPVEAYSDYGITRASADSYYSLSVEYTPANTTFQETDFEIAFKNPSSTWANGKNVGTYATLLHEEGSKQARLTINKSFSEPIIITARSKRSPEIFGTARVDYLYRSFNATINDQFDNPIEINNIFDPLTFYISDFKDGTLLPDLEKSYVEITIRADGFADYMESNGWTYGSSDQVPASDTFSYKISIQDALDGVDVCNLKQAIIGLIGEHYEDNARDSWNDACSFFLNGYTPEQCSGNCICYIEWDFVRYYDRGQYGYSVINDKVGVDYTEIALNDWSGFEISATDITLKPDGIVGW